MLRRSAISNWTQYTNSTAMPNSVAQWRHLLTCSFQPSRSDLTGTPDLRLALGAAKSIGRQTAYLTSRPCLFSAVRPNRLAGSIARFSSRERASPAVHARPHLAAPSSIRHLHPGYPCGRSVPPDPGSLHAPIGSRVLQMPCFEALPRPGD